MAQLKRTVTIKAIVTEDFKKYLKHELTVSISNMDKKLQQMEIQGKQLVDSLTQQSAMEQVNSIKQQLELERQQHKQAKAELTQRITESNSLELGSEFIQGTIDSFVEIKKGDNLYEKLGAMEVVIKDGIVQEIRGE